MITQILSQFQIDFIPISLESLLYLNIVRPLTELSFTFDWILLDSWSNSVWPLIEFCLTFDRILSESSNFVWILSEPQSFDFIYLFADKMSDKISITKLIGQSNYEVWSLRVQSLLVYRLLSDAIEEGASPKPEVD